MHRVSAPQTGAARPIGPASIKVKPRPQRQDNRQNSPTPLKKQISGQLFPPSPRARALQHAPSAARSTPPRHPCFTGLPRRAPVEAPLACLCSPSHHPNSVSRQPAPVARVKSWAVSSGQPARNGQFLLLPCALSLFRLLLALGRLPASPLPPTSSDMATTTSSAVWAADSSDWLPPSTSAAGATAARQQQNMLDLDAVETALSEALLLRPLQLDSDDDRDSDVTHSDEVGKTGGAVLFSRVRYGGPSRVFWASTRRRGDEDPPPYDCSNLARGFFVRLVIVVFPPQPCQLPLYLASSYPAARCGPRRCLPRSPHPTA